MLLLRRTSTFVLGVVAAIAVSVSGPTPSLGEPIFMPLGSTVWMKFEANACPDADGDDCAGSNQLGLAPPNGIPLTTIGPNAQSLIATGYAEILPDRVRTLISGNSAAFMWASFVDTYTVHGTAGGPFDITVNLHVTGTASNGSAFGLISAFAQAEIGTFNPASDVSGVPVAEQFRITPFDGSIVGQFQAAGGGGAVSIPIDITASYTRTVSVGEVFDIAYGVNTSFAVGEIDLLDTASISFSLPAGVFLTSVLGGTFGASAVPEPSALLPIAAALGALASVAAIRRHRPARHRRGGR